MKKIMTLALTASALLSIVSAGNGATEEKAKSGEELFKANCAACHPEGGNIVNPDFTLKKKDRERHGVKTATDIMKKMRHPGPGMTKFDKAALSDEDAKKIASYIIKTFN